jgi:LysM repeat protein
MKHKFVIILVLISMLALAVPLTTRASDYASGSCVQWYTVQRGDALYKIAWRFGTSTGNLARINNLYNPNLIYPGQQLCIQGGGPVGRPYVVQYGDTLFRIAQRFGVNLYALASNNSIFNLNRIYAGQTLYIPDFTIQS